MTSDSVSPQSGSAAATAKAAVERAYALANDKNLAAGQVFHAIVEVKAATDILTDRCQELEASCRDYEEQLGRTEGWLRTSESRCQYLEGVIRDHWSPSQAEKILSEGK